MDSLRGIPVEYKLDAFNMPRTGTTLCHPKIGYVDLSVIPLSTRMEITPTLPKCRTRNSRWHPKFNSYTCNMSFVKMQKTVPHVRRHTLPPQPPQHTIKPFRLKTHNLLRVLQHQKQTQYSMLQIKPIHKTPFDSRHLSSSSSFYFSQT